MLLGFKSIYADKIKAGTKITTIRTHRKITPKLGEKIYMYMGLRTKNCQKIGEATIKRIDNISIYAPEIFVNAKTIRGSEKLKLAQNDGFDCPDDLFVAIQKMHGYEGFRGILITWENFIAI